MYSQDVRSTEYRETLRKRARTHSVRKTDLHPLVRCDEGMKGLRPVETWERKSLGESGDVLVWNNVGDEHLTSVSACPF